MGKLRSSPNKKALFQINIDGKYYDHVHVPESDYSRYNVGDIIGQNKDKSESPIVSKKDTVDVKIPHLYIEKK